MTNEEQLIERGAQCVAGRLILRHTVVGSYLNGDFTISAEGIDELDVVEVVAKPAKAAAKPVAKAKAAKGETAAVEPNTQDELSDLLGE